MPIPSSIEDLSQTPGSNPPMGSESPTTADDYFRVGFSYDALHRDGKGYSAEVDVTSAATCDVGAANSFCVRITGTTTITSLGTPSMPGPRFIRFAGALTLTHNASTLILPGGSDIVTTAGDTCVATPMSGGWVVSQYHRANAADLVPAGTVIHVARSSAPTGYLKANGGTIGSASSGGTSRANADTLSLFTVLWNDFSNTVLPIQDSSGAATTRGASAAADFAANKRLPLPDLRAEFIRGLDDGRGIDSGRALGSAQTDLLKSHTHSVSSSATVLLTNGGVGYGVNSGSTETGSAGGAETRPRNVALLACIKF